MSGRKKSMTFEEAMERLKEIVAKMEDGQLSLEESLSLFKEGMDLSALCNHKLDDAERKVTIITKGEDKNVEEKKFISGEDSNE